MKFGLYSHPGDWSQSETQWQAEFLNKPLLSFEVPKHPGNAGSAFSMISFNSPKVGVMTLKRSEQGDYYIIRVNELTGSDLTGINLKFPGKILEAFEVNGQEQKIATAEFSGNTMSLDLSHYSIRSFAFKLAPQHQLQISQSPAGLHYDQDVISFDNNRTDGNMVPVYDPADHGNVCNYPAEQMPDQLVSEGVVFQMGSCEDLQKNVVTCKGQEIQLPAGEFNKVYLLASATTETSADFMVKGEPVSLTIANWRGFIGQHYDRKFDLDGYTVRGVKEPFLKQDNIAWFASHWHFGYPTRNEPYSYSYIFKYAINLPPDTKSVTLPDNAKIKVFAITAVRNMGDDLKILFPLADDFKDSKTFSLRKEGN
jgi:alpha-mannosidase